MVADGNSVPGDEVAAMRDPVVDALAGAAPFALVIRNVRYVNLLTREIYDSEIAVAGGKIAHERQPGEAPVGGGRQEYHAAGRSAIPGLIDTHVHTESTMSTPANTAAAELVHGTTAIACAKAGKLRYVLELPIAGLMSDKPIAELAPYRPWPGRCAGASDPAHSQRDLRGKGVKP